jgi:hypothetical protein
MFHMCVYMHSHFIENHPIRILEDGPRIFEGVLSQEGDDLRGSVIRLLNFNRKIYSAEIFGFCFLLLKSIHLIGPRSGFQHQVLFLLVCCTHWDGQAKVAHASTSLTDSVSLPALFPSLQPDLCRVSWVAVVICSPSRSMVRLLAPLPVSLDLVRATGSRSAGDEFFFQSICSSRSIFPVSSLRFAGSVGAGGFSLN